MRYSFMGMPLLAAIICRIGCTICSNGPFMDLERL